MFDRVDWIHDDIIDINYDLNDPFSVGNCEKSQEGQ